MKSRYKIGLYIAIILVLTTIMITVWYIFKVGGLLESGMFVFEKVENLENNNYMNIKKTYFWESYYNAKSHSKTA